MTIWHTGMLADSAELRTEITHELLKAGHACTWDGERTLYTDISAEWLSDVLNWIKKRKV